MAQRKTYIDGIRDSLTGDYYDFNQRMKREFGRVAVKLTPRPDLTTFTLNGRSRVNLIAVDWGNSNPIERAGSISTSRTDFGDTITLFYSDEFSFFSDSSAFFSQIETLHTPFPGTAQSLNIQNENFTAPNGLFIRPTGVTYRPTFAGSTFKIAPRIYNNFDDVQNLFYMFSGYNGTLRTNTYWPFRNCPNVKKIEYQGDISDDCVALGSVNFTYIDEDGIERYDAYPQGGNPEMVYRYVGQTIENYVLGVSDPLPTFGTEKLRFVDYPYAINNVIIGAASGNFTTSLMCPELTNPDIYDSPTMRLKMPTVKLSEDVIYTGNFMYGAKLFGIKEFPSSLIQLNDNISGVVRYTQYDYEYYANVPKVEDDKVVVRPEPVLTPKFIKQNISFSLGQALEQMYEDDSTPLLVPDIDVDSSVLQSVDMWYSAVEPDEFIYSTPVVIDGDFNPQPVEVKPLPNTVKWITSYCANLFSVSGIGSGLTFNINGQTYDFDNHITIPSLPTSLEVVASYLENTFQGCHGKAVSYEMDIMNARRPTIAYLTSKAYGDTSSSTSLDHNKLIINSNTEIYGDSNLATMVAQSYNYTMEDIYEHVKTRGFDPQYPELATSLYDLVIMDGITIEDNDCPNLEYAINWQKGMLEAANVIPGDMILLKVIPNIETIKTENAYSGLFNVTKIYTTGGARYSIKDTLPSVTLWNNNSGQRPILFRGSGTYAYEPLKQQFSDWFALTLDDFNIPEFFLKNQNLVNYNVFKGGLSSGNVIEFTPVLIDQFIMDHGIDNFPNTNAAIAYLTGVNPYNNSGSMKYPLRAFQGYFNYNITRYTYQNTVGNTVTKYYALPLVHENFRPPFPSGRLSRNNGQGGWVMIGRYGANNIFDVSTNALVDSYLSLVTNEFVQL